MRPIVSPSCAGRSLAHPYLPTDYGPGPFFKIDLVIQVLDTPYLDIPALPLAQRIHRVHATRVGCGVRPHEHRWRSGRWGKTMGYTCASPNGCLDAGWAAQYGCHQNTEFLAGSEPGVVGAACKGDSAGPAFVWDDKFDHWYLAGIVSRAFGGKRKSPRVCSDGGLYLRTDRFSDWIDGIRTQYK